MDFRSLKAEQVAGLVKSGEIRRGAVYSPDPESIRDREQDTRDWACEWTALMRVAADSPDPAVFAALVGCGLDPLETNPSGVTCLMAAAACNPVLRMAATCLENGVPVSERDRHGIAAIHLVALNNTPAHLDLLVEWGEEIDCVSLKGDTPLMMSAIRRDGGEMSRHLLDRGAEIDATDARGITSLMFALRAGNKDAALALIDAGADLGARDKKGMGPVEHYAMCLATGTAQPDDDVLEALGGSPGAKRTLH